MTEEELMLTTIKGCRRIDLYVDREPLTEAQRKRFNDMRLLREAAEPLQYILGYCAFLNIELKVNKSVLIPRPETELLAQTIINIANFFNSKPVRILDIGTGSGNIALSLASNIKDCRVIASDISKEAIALAKKNARLNKLEDKVVFIESDLFAYFNNSSDNAGEFDIIVSNPPYIPTDKLHCLPLDVRKEPRLALDGGVDGLDYYRRIAKGAHDYLNKNGYLFLEIGDGQKEYIEKIFDCLGVWKTPVFVKDYRQTERILITRVK